MSFKAEALAGALLLLFAAGVVLIGWSSTPGDLGGDGPVYLYIQVGSFVFNLPPFITGTGTTIHALLWIAGISAAAGMAFLYYSAVRTYRQSRKTAMATQRAGANNDT